MRKNIFENEEEAKEVLKEIVEICPTGEIAIDASLFNLKQAGLIRQSAYEELMEYVDKLDSGMIKISVDKEDITIKTLRTKIQAYRDEKHPLFQSVKGAGEKTFNALFDYIIRILSTIPGVDTDKLNQLVQDVIQSERNAVDKE